MSRAADQSEFDLAAGVVGAVPCFAASDRSPVSGRKEGEWPELTDCGRLCGGFVSLFDHMAIRSWYTANAQATFRSRLSPRRFLKSEVLCSRSDRILASWLRTLFNP